MKFHCELVPSGLPKVQNLLMTCQLSLDPSEFLYSFEAMLNESICLFGVLAGTNPEAIALAEKHIFFRKTELVQEAAQAMRPMSAACSVPRPAPQTEGRYTLRLKSEAIARFSGLLHAYKLPLEGERMAENALPIFNTALREFTAAIQKKTVVDGMKLLRAALNA